MATRMTRKDTESAVGRAEGDGPRSRSAEPYDRREGCNWRP